jgi:hypothetical protein
VLDPLDVLAHLAALTRRVRLGTSAVLALLQPPVLLARRLATVDQLSGGRVVAGLAAGWMREEFAAAGLPHSGTGHRLEEHVAAMRAVWGPDPVDLSEFRTAADAAGRDPAALPIVLRGDAVPDPDAGTGRPLFRGTLAQWVDDCRRVADLGVGHVALQVDAPVDVTLELLHELRCRIAA